jgi:uncharacterized membrane protein
MGPIAALTHLLSFAAPAISLALLVTLGAHFFMKKRPPALALSTQLAINIIANIVVLALGLWLMGRDGKMVSYAVMVVMCATSQWLMARGWQA